MSDLNRTTIALYLSPLKKLRLTFSLRCLLVIVAIISAFLAYHVEWIRRRNAFRRNERVAFPIYTRGFQEAPLTLRIFGEQGEANVAIDEPRPGEVDQIKHVFPEATVITWDEDVFVEMKREMERESGQN